MSERTAVRFLSLSIAAGIAAAIVVLYINGVTQKDDKQQAQAELVQSAEKIKAACTTNPAQVRALLGTDACTKAKEITERPAAEKGDPGAVGPSGAPGRPGPAGRPGPGPSTAQVATAVTAYCSGGRCAGKSPTPAQVAAAVAAYCASKGECAGPTGTQGEQGSEGKQGPPPTDAQVAAAVTQYCGQETSPCRGADGADSTVPGPAGPAGPAGPSCPAGSTLQTQHVLTTEAPTGIAVAVCVLTDQNP